MVYHQDEKPGIERGEQSPSRDVGPIERLEKFIARQDLVGDFVPFQSGALVASEYLA